MKTTKAKTSFVQRRSETVTESNALFKKIGELVEDEVRRGTEDIDVLEILQKADFGTDESTLQKLQIGTNVTPISFLPWYLWFPWRPLWAHFWTQRFPGSPVAQYLGDRRAAAFSGIMTDMP